MNKKAALELSITAIVVLIIAITVLGLGIGFIKKQFGAGSELVTKEFANIKEQMKEQVRTGGELLVFSVPDQVSIGKPQSVFIGVRNTAKNTNSDRDKVCFRVEVRCIKPFTPNAYCDPNGQKNNIVVGGYDWETGDPVKGNTNWFKSLLGEFDLKNFEGDVYDAVLLVRGISADSYSMEINIYKDPTDDWCENQNFGTKPRSEELYASKSFVLNVV